MAVYYPEVRTPSGIVRATVGVAVLPGDPVGWDIVNQRYAKADPDAAGGPIQAQFIVVEGGAASAIVQLCRRCTLVNVDAPWTTGDQLFASGTNGALQGTPYSTSGHSVPAIGFVASPTEAAIDCSATLTVPVVMRL